MGGGGAEKVVLSLIMVGLCPPYSRVGSGRMLPRKFFYVSLDQSSVFLKHIGYEVFVFFCH